MFGQPDPPYNGSRCSNRLATPTTGNGDGQYLTILRACGCTTDDHIGRLPGIDNVVALKGRVIADCRCSGIQGQTITRSRCGVPGGICRRDGYRNRAIIERGEIRYTIRSSN